MIEYLIYSRFQLDRPRLKSGERKNASGLGDLGNQLIVSLSPCLPTSLLPYLPQ